MIAPRPEQRRRLTPLGVRFLLFGLFTSVFAASVGARPLLALGVGVGLLPILSYGTLPTPAGRALARMPSRMQAGVPARLHIDLVRASERSGAPLLVTVEIDGWPPLTAWSEAQARDAKACIDFDVIPPARGVLSRWRIVAEARDPLGFAHSSVTWKFGEQRVWLVHPATIAALAVPHQVLPDIPEFSGLRAWQAGDRPRDVDWRATARRPSTAPVVRLWTEAPSRDGEMVIGIAGGPDVESCERIAELAAAAVRDALRRTSQVTLRWASGEVTATTAEPLLDALAAFPTVGLPSPADCDLLIVPASGTGAGTVTATAIWRVDRGGRVVAA